MGLYDKGIPGHAAPGPSNPGFQFSPYAPQMAIQQNAQKLPTPMGSTPSGPKALDTSGSNAWMDQLMKFYELMMQPLDPNDPRYSGLLNGAYAQAAHGTQNRGIGGPMNTSFAQNAYLNLGNQMNHQRQGMALSALGTGLSGYGQQQSLQAQQAWQRYQADMQRYQQNSNSGIGAGIGGAIGAGVGALGFLGGPGLGLTTMGLGASAGSALGAGFGGLTNGPMPTYQGSYGGTPYKGM